MGGELLQALSSTTSFATSSSLLGGNHEEAGSWKRKRTCARSHDAWGSLLSSRGNQACLAAGTPCMYHVLPALDHVCPEPRMGELDASDALASHARGDVGEDLPFERGSLCFRGDDVA